MRVRGLKPWVYGKPELVSHVAPYAGAWIETTMSKDYEDEQRESHPMRVRGLKLDMACAVLYGREVAPYAGAWIETSAGRANGTVRPSRTLCGCVD